MKIPPAALFQALKEAGWIDCGSVATPEHQTKKHIFCAPHMLADYKKPKLREMLANTMKFEEKPKDDEKPKEDNVVPMPKSKPKWV